jgi:hypothetical protein
MLKLILPLLVTSFIQSTFVAAQLPAGSVPSGMSAVDPNVNLSVAVVAQDTSISFDIDCDGANDMRVELYKGHVAVDGVSSAYLYLINDSFAISADTVAISYPSVAYFNVTDIINPFVNQWRTDNQIVLGCYGGFVCQGPASANGLYIAYRKTLSNSTHQIGWIKITFNLIDQGVPNSPITLSIPELLTFCDPTAIDKLSQSAYHLYPNPSIDYIQLQGAIGVKQIQIFNLLGERVEVINGNPGVITLPLQTGIYIIRVINENGFSWEEKILRQ